MGGGGGGDGLRAQSSEGSENWKVDTVQDEDVIRRMETVDCIDKVQSCSTLVDSYEMLW